MKNPVTRRGLAWLAIGGFAIVLPIGFVCLFGIAISLIVLASVAFSTAIYLGLSWAIMEIGKSPIDHAEDRS